MSESVEGQIELPRSVDLAKVVLLLVGLVVGGGTATGLTRGSDTETRAELRADLRASKAEIVGEIRRLGDRIGSQEKAFERLQASLAEHEKLDAHPAAVAQINNLARRVAALEAAIKRGGGK